MSKKGCGCKKTSKVMNNLNNVDYITQAKETYNEVIVGKTLEDYTDLDKVLIYQTYNNLYPSSSSQPSLEQAINKIKEGIEIYDIKHRKK
jgi:hypothetical protein